MNAAAPDRLTETDARVVRLASLVRQLTEVVVALAARVETLEAKP